MMAFPIGTDVNTVVGRTEAKSKGEERAATQQMASTVDIDVIKL
jgi:hypothetical protein